MNEEFKLAAEKIRENGQTLSRWAVQNGLSVASVYMLIRGAHRGRYGESRRVAQLLRKELARQHDRQA
ncbi:MAG: hypothetical protein IJS87_00180 [Rhodocyclaceae bacterium]|nr:hypothetical protein [Rhodocyclaceae bacterium]